MSQPLDPKKQAAQAAMVRLMGTRPEPIMAMLERLEIPWERREVDEKSCLVISWHELMAGERKLQNSPTFMENLMREIGMEHGDLLKEMKGEGTQDVSMQ